MSVISPRGLSSLFKVLTLKKVCAACGQGVPLCGHVQFNSVYRKAKHIVTHGQLQPFPLGGMWHLKEEVFAH